MDTNLDTWRALGADIARELAGGVSSATPVVAGPLHANYYSFTFTLDAGSAGQVFVKIPKTDLRTAGGAILPLTRDDRRMAEDEVSSLRMLASDWVSDDLRVSWVKLRAFVPAYNAVVTDRVEAQEALDVFRRLDLRRRIGGHGEAQRLRSMMGRFGAALGRFHQRHARAMRFQSALMAPKLRTYAAGIESSPFGARDLRLGERLPRIPERDLPAIEAPSFKGIDIRNVLVDGTDRLFLLDPGRMKAGCREAGLARFLMTYRILYWGSRLFAFGFRPDAEAETAFADAYYANGPERVPEILDWFLLKEQLKHWNTAIYSLTLRAWPFAAKKLVAATYVNPYYQREVAKSLKKLHA